MLMGLLRTDLRPYGRPLLAVVALQLVATIASLYLPTLNADIIDQGVVTGDTGYILRIGGDARGHRRAVRLLGRRPSTSAPARRWPSAATCAPQLFSRVGEFSARRWPTSGRPR